MKVLGEDENHFDSYLTGKAVMDLILGHGQDFYDMEGILSYMQRNATGETKIKKWICADINNRD